MKKRPSIHLTKALPSMAIALISFISLAQSSQGAVTISITGMPSSSTALVTLSGELTTIFPMDPRNALNVRVPLGNNITGFLGNDTDSGASATSWLHANFFPLEGGAAPDSAVVTYNPSGEEVGPTLMFPTYMIGAPSGAFNLRQLATTSLPAMAAGVTITFSGSFDLDLLAGATFEETFISGTHEGAYAGQSVTVVVAPEPNSSVLFSLAFVGLMTRRMR